jgi:hypothetical protein
MWIIVFPTNKSILTLFTKVSFMEGFIDMYFIHNWIENIFIQKLDETRNQDSN